MNKEVFIKNIDKLLNLKDGWYDGLGKAPNKNICNILKEFWLKNFDNILYPEVFPTYEGNILFEWDSNEYDITLEIYLEEFKCVLFPYFHNENKNLNDYYNYSLNNEKDINDLKNILQILLK